MTEERVTLTPGRPSLIPAKPPTVSASRNAWRRVEAFLDEIGGMSILFGEALRALSSRPFEYREVIYQLYQMGVRSVTIAPLNSAANSARPTR